MCHSYDVITPLSKQITCDCGVFIPVFNSTKNYKNRPRNTRIIVNNKVAPFFEHGVECV